MQKTIFITGASSGLGKTTAKLFQSKGWNVIATIRNPDNETELTKLDNVTILKLDVTDKTQIEETVQKAIQEYSVDIVLNNAGYGLIGYPTCSIYSATKFALDGFSECLAYDLAHFGVKVKIIAPGGMQTDFAGRSMDGGQHEAYQQLVEKVSEGYSAEKIANYMKAEDVAQIIYEAATDNKEQLRYIAGQDAISLYSEREKIGSESQYRKIQEILKQTPMWTKHKHDLLS